MSVDHCLRKINFFSRLFFVVTCSRKCTYSFVSSTHGLLLRAKKDMDSAEFMFFLTGGVGLENKLKNPAPQWLSDKSWDELCRMCDLKAYKGTTHTH